MRRTSWLVAVVSTAAAIAVFEGCGTPKVQSADRAAPPAVPVSTATATRESVPIEIRVVGIVEPSAIVQVRSQIAGELMSVHFTEGANVNKGDLLFDIDPRPYQEAVRQAEAAVLRDTALLHQAEASLGRDTAQERFAQADAARYDSLMKEGVMSRAQSDQVRTNADALHESVRADQAAIESARATLEADKVAVAKAKLDLSYCQIRSPISGRSGNLLVHAGNLVAANSGNPLVVLHQITPIFVSFGVPQDQLPAIRQRSEGRKLTVRASVQGEPAKRAGGFLSVIDNTVDTSTGTIKLKGTFDNEQRWLWPGQFVDVALTLDLRSNATVVPAESVQAGQKGQFAFVVKPDHTVEPRVVKVGPAVGNKLVVESGIAPGETVVTDGQLRLFPGARVQPVASPKGGADGEL